jgi:hypothetical protein
MVGFYRGVMLIALCAMAGCHCGPSELQTCPDGGCVGGCIQDSDCASGEVCVAEACLKACNAAADCGAAGACIDNYCTPLTDAGSSKDAGATDAGRDAGSAHDAGQPVDAGAVDSGSPDAGARDAGSPVDAGSCPASATLVYVIDANGTLSSFTPAPTPHFTDLGTLNCPAASGLTPYSMSVDRNPVAWVLYASANSNNSQIFKVDIATLTCTATTFASGQQGFTQFGMGFVANTGGTTDSLFLANSLNALGNGDLASLDTGTLAVHDIGLLNGSPELTGTADGRLFAYFPGNADPMNLMPPAIAQLDKTNGNQGNGWPFLNLEDSPCQDPSGQCTLDYAFAFWGGDFWIFLKLSNDSSTTVWQFNPSNQALNDVLDSTGRHIVGAGVSTCAPLVAQ